MENFGKALIFLAFSGNWTVEKRGKPGKNGGKPLFSPDRNAGESIPYFCASSFAFPSILYFLIFSIKMQVNPLICNPEKWENSVIHMIPNRVIPGPWIKKSRPQLIL